MPSPPGSTEPFLGRPRPVELVTALRSLSVSAGSVTMTCATDRYEPELQDYYGTVCETVLRPPGPGRDATVVADFWTPTVVRFRCAPGPEVPATPLAPLVGGPAALSPMVVRGPDPGVRLTVEEDADRVRVTAGAVTLTVVRDPWRLELHDAGGRLLWATRPADIDGLRLAPVQWHPPEQRWLFLHRYAYPLGSTAGPDPVATVAFDLAHDEHVVGLGESYGRVDKVGTAHDLAPAEAFGNASPATYKPVPFYLSSRGHGVFVHTANPVRVDVGAREHTAVSVAVEGTAALDWFVLAGDPATVLDGYLDLTGRPPVPPPWSFGFWLGRITYSSQQEVEAVAAELRARDMPADVIHVDTGWFPREYVCDLTFSAERFPDPAGMVRRLRALGLRVSLWQWPNYTVGSTLFDEALAAGHLATRPSGHAHTVPGGYGEDAGVLDLSSPAAVTWYQDKLAALFDLGIAAIKADYGDGAPAAGYARVPAAAARAAYPLLYQDAVWQASRAAHGDDAVIWARAGWAGAQRYPVHWSGDGVARFADLACVLRAMLSMSLSGFHFYSHDVGGFSGQPDPELYLRWLQLGIVSSHVRAHGSPPREPWAYGPEAEGIARDLLRLRYRLLPYLYTAAVEGVRTGRPLVRPLLLERPDDPVGWGVEDQFWLGPDLMAAPVLERSAASRSVYLPAGDWYAHGTGEHLAGGRRHEVATPLAAVPLFVRGGAVLPLGPDQRYVGEHPDGPLELHFWGEVTPGRTVVRLDAGTAVEVAWEPAADGPALRVRGAPGEVRAVRH